MARWDDEVRFHVMPGLLLTLPIVAPLLALWGAGVELSVLYSSCLICDTFSWTVVSVFVLWAYVWLRLTSSTAQGPLAPYGVAPVYKGNGVTYYWASLAAFFALQAWWTELSQQLYEHMPRLLATLNVCALLLCAWLFAAGRRQPPLPSDTPPRGPALYQFFTGMQLHPHILGVDVKQLTNCRVGLMAWQLLVIAFYIAGVSRNGFSSAALANMLLQSVYIAKFFWWEAGYFGTLDMTLDRAGYYICWGCLVWVPCFYTFSSYYMVAHPPVVRAPAAIFFTILGIASILLNYRVDYEKQVFRAAGDGRCNLWGRPARCIEVSDGRKLLVSGCWGVARHLNYTFELLAALAWSLPGWGLGPAPFFYFIFLLILLLHRTYRDEEKCSSRYGDAWKIYCHQVPYRLLPYLY